MSKLIIEPSPHIKSGVTTQKIMLSVIIALLPALFASVWIFGLRALIMTVICCTSCVILRKMQGNSLKMRLISFSQQS